MKKAAYLLTFTASLILGFGPSCGLAADKEFVVDPSQDHGKWEAWGTSLCWWANVFGDRDDLADLFFTTKTVNFQGRDLPGLGYNFARYNAGACSSNEVDGEKMRVSKIIMPYRQMQGFWLDGKSEDPKSSSWDWSVDAKQRAALQKAKERGVNYFELFSNSPMWWMCKNKNPSGAAKATDDNLAPEHAKNFAIYMATVAEQAKEKWGIEFTTIDPFNEPSSRWWFDDCKQEGCHFDPKTQEKFIPLLKKELDQRRLSKLTIATSDENTYDEAIASWRSFSPTVRSMVGQINVHGYQGQEGRRAELFDLASKDKKKLWNSEYGDGNGSGMEMAQNLNLDFQKLRMTAWTYWQPLDGGGWGMIDTDFSSNTLKEVTPKYFVMAQYSRHIRPGMKIIESGAKDTVAAYDPAEGRLALVICNDAGEKDVTFDLSRFNTSKAAAARWVTIPKQKVGYDFRRNVKLDHGRLTCRIEAKSVQTIEVRNIQK
jgi:galactan endo-1,6-beta-galactosidase